MQTPNANQDSSSQASGWYLLGEYALSKFLSDTEKGDKIATGLLSQTARDMNTQVECVENIEVTLRSLAREMLAHFKQGRVELPERIRIFCKKRVIDAGIKGGWGYFLIERSRESSTSGCSEPHHFIDLYFYEEGK